MFLADLVGTTLTHIGGRRRCLACITKNSVLWALSLSLLHAIHAYISLAQASILNRAADSSLGPGLNDT